MLSGVWNIVVFANVQGKIAYFRRVPLCYTPTYTLPRSNMVTLSEFAVPFSPKYYLCPHTNLSVKLQLYISMSCGGLRSCVRVSLSGFVVCIIRSTFFMAKRPPLAADLVRGRSIWRGVSWSS